VALLWHRRGLGRNQPLMTDLISLDNQLSEYEKTIKEVGIQAIWLIGEQLLKAKERIIEITGDGRAPGFSAWAENKIGFNERTIRRYIKAFQENLNDPALIWGNKKLRTLTSETFEQSDTCTISDLYTLIDQCKTFGTIYADPPWQYGNQATRAATSNHYDTLMPDEIAELPISQLTNENAHLHLWTTNAFLFECPNIMESWGFEWKSSFVWVKQQMGIGNYWRVSHEFLLLGVKGSLPFMAKDEKSWIELPRGKHSSKPEEIVDKIERVSPGPYLELFGRRTRKNWTVWGNQIPKQSFLEM